MRCAKRFGWCAPLLVFCLLSSGLAQRRATGPQTTSTAPSVDDAALLRAIVERLYAAYAQEDLVGALALWSDKAPELASYRQSTPQMFESADAVFSTPSINMVKVTGTRATLRLTIERKIVDAQTKQTTSERLRRNYEFVKERGKWKILRESSAVMDLAVALIAATLPEQRSLLLSEKELVSVDLRRALVGQGSALYVDGKYKEALDVYRLAQRVATEIDDQQGIAATFLNMGSAYFGQANYGAALEHFQQALARFEQLKERADTATTLYAIGLVHKEQGRNAQAMEFLQRALRQFEELDDKTGVMRTLEATGSVSYAQGDYRAAAQSFEKSLALRAELDDDEGLAGALASVGNAYYEQGGYAQALDYYQKALAQFEASEDEVGLGSTLGNIGNVYYSQGNYPSALESYQKSLAVQERAGDKKGFAYTFLRIGDVFRAQNNYGLALQYYQRGLALNQELGNEANVATAQGNLGTVYATLEDYARALERYQLSLAISERLDDKADVARQLGNTGSAHYGLGNYGPALAAFQKSFTLREALGDKAGLARMLGQIGGVYYAQGNHAQALEYYQKSLAGEEEIGNKARIAGTLLDLAQVHVAQGNYAQALSLSERAAALANQFGSPGLLWYAQYRIGAAQRLLNRPEPSRAAFEESIKTIETMRSLPAQADQLFSRELSAPYLAMVELLVSENRASEAFAYAERASAQALLDVVRGGAANINKGLSTQETERERKLTTEAISLGAQINVEKQRKQPDEALLSSLNARWRQTQLELEAFTTKLYAAHPELKIQRGEARPAIADEGVGLLPESKGALLKYVVAEDKTYLFVLTREPERREPSGTLKVYTLDIKRRELAERTSRFLQQLYQPGGQFQQGARELYDILLKPAEGQLQGNGSLIIVPGAGLWDVPFEALQRAENHYLLEDYAVSYGPSVTALRELSRLRSRESNARAPSTPNLFALGSPAPAKEALERIKLAYGVEGLDASPEVTKEVRALGQLYGPAQSRIYTGAEASEGRVKTEAQNYRTLHMAAWGVLDDASPLYSFVALAPGVSAPVREDGLLELREIVALNLRADVVVWTGMRTARRRAGEGINGLTWALFIAGTPTNVVSRWPVSSPATTALMLEFHRHLKAASQDPKATRSTAKAWQQAALKLLRGNEYKHPSFWSGFMVIGVE
ncbi:MAG: tetratricopeptide repeat protein [Pyrinomonadaceae bacterium]